MEKAPDAFRTISEVADDLDLPQHVLRFWETRFTQIKPMKRSGGRRYYRPDDVDLLRGIRRLLYGEGYTIRGVQRILKEHGVKAVQALAEAAAVPSFGAIEDELRRSLAEPDDGDGFSFGSEDEDFESVPPERPESTRGPGPMVSGSAPAAEAGRAKAGPLSGPEHAARGDAAGLQAILDDLVACRRLLDEALDGAEAVAADS